MADAVANLVRLRTGEQWGVFILQIFIAEFASVLRQAYAPAWNHLYS